MTTPGKIEYITVDEKEVPYSIRKSRRARRLLLHIDISGEMELVLPYWVTYKQGAAFVHSRKKWIEEQLQAQAVRARSIPKYEFVTGERIACFGELYDLVFSAPQQARTTITQTKNTIHVKGKNPERALKRWYVSAAKQFLTSVVAELAAEINEYDVTVRINSARSQWGSCNPAKKDISFTWRLAMAPPEVARYVAAHEVAHLKYASHGKRFWQLVKKLDPLCEQHKAYLKERGHSLTL